MQSRNTALFQITLPAEELVEAQAVSAASFINIQETAIHGDNDFGLPLSHPAPLLRFREIAGRQHIAARAERYQ